MSEKINSKGFNIQKAFGVSDEHVNGISEKLAAICGLATEGKEPAGFLAKQVVSTFNMKDLQIIATMFMVRVINEQTEELGGECDCPGCMAMRGEEVTDDDVIRSLKQMMADKFPGMEAMVVKVPKPGKGKTDC